MKVHKSHPYACIEDAINRDISQELNTAGISNIQTFYYTPRNCNRRRANPRVENHVKQHMAKFDASHDFAHIKRVVRRAHIIHDEIIADAARTNQPVPQYDVTTITLSALLHDVGDRKYVNLKKENPKTMINTLLLGFGANTELAVKVQTICSAVSYFEEMKDLLVVRNLINQYPELAIVQDADRLDSLGAIGIGRVFTYGGAKTDRSMLESIDIFDWKLLKIAAFDEDRTRQRNGTGSDGTIGAV